MQIVVTLSEEDYNLLVNVNDDKLPSMNARRHLHEQLKIGIVLPKGHGRLIDANALEKGSFWETKQDLLHTPTVIQADRDRPMTIKEKLDCPHSYYESEDDKQEVLYCDIGDCECNGCESDKFCSNCGSIMKVKKEE